MDSDLPQRPDFLPPGFGTLGHRDFVEIIVPEPVSYAPHTTAWLLLSALVLGLVAWAVMRAVLHYQKNAYRRAALVELTRLRQRSELDRETALLQLTQLLKRTALGAYSRSRVAALSGQEWIDFLERAAPGALSKGAKRALGQLNCHDANELPRDDDVELFLGVERWLRGHHASR